MGRLQIGMQTRDMLETNPQKETNRSLYFSLFASLASTFLISISAGINSIIFPLSLQEKQDNNSMIGGILSVELVASIIACLYIAKVLSHLNLYVKTVLAAIVRVVAILALGYFSSTISWVAGLSSFMELAPIHF